MSPRPLTLTASLAVLAVLAGTGRLDAQSASDLAKQTQNPVADLVSLPFQFNFNTGGDLGDQTLFNLNFQPVIPVKVSPKWTIIARTIVPFFSVPTAGPHISGVGDIQEQLFLSPAKAGKLIWGIGTVMSFPTATNEAVRTGSWAVGPNLVMLKMTGSFVLGALANQAWTYADEGGAPEVNQFLLQPFINYNFGVGWALSFSPIITANWNAASGDQWTVPLGLGLTKTTVFNKRPMSIGAQYYHNVVHPTGSAGNQLRIVLSLLYPNAPKPPVKPAD